MTGDVHVLLIGNYEPDRQPSMQRFADLLHDGLSSRGLPVTLLRPRTIAGGGGGRGLAKWSGYLDKFVLFVPALRQALRAHAARPLVVHVCDHSNSVYVPWIRHVPHVVTCHDLLAVRSARGEFAETSTRWSGRLLQSAIVRGLRHARRIACDSDATMADVQRIVGTAAERVAIIHPAIAPVFTPVPAADALERVRRLLARDGGRGDGTIESGYLLHVGGNQWYKNRAGLIATYAALVDAVPGAPPLIVAGKPLTVALRREIERRGLTRRVVELTNVTDADLAALYSCAGLLLFPSLAEGYGWPVLEAMACGCRVVSSDRAPLSEIAGGLAAPIDPCDPVGAASVVAWVLREPADERQAHVAAGRAWAARFSGDRMIDAYVQTYGGVLATSAGVGR